MSKISDLTPKTAAEVEDHNLLALEDEEDTKSITVGELKELLRPIQERFVKEIINETIDRIADAVLSCKYEFIEIVTKRYQLNTWIGSASGNIQIALLDIDTNKWLTQQDILDLFDIDEDRYSISVMINHTWESPVNIRTLSFNEEHDDPAAINQWMYDGDAGFLKIHFDGLTNNEISRIIYEDIRITREPDEDGTKYEFIVSRDSFANAVPYVADVPGGCPCCPIRSDR